jgi:hypothetical protein
MTQTVRLLQREADEMALRRKIWFLVTVGGSVLVGAWVPYLDFHFLASKPEGYGEIPHALPYSLFGIMLMGILLEKTRSFLKQYKKAKKPLYELFYHRPLGFTFGLMLSGFIRDLLHPVTDSFFLPVAPLFFIGFAYAVMHIVFGRAHH